MVEPIISRKFLGWRDKLHGWMRMVTWPPPYSNKFMRVITLIFYVG